MGGVSAGPPGSGWRMAHAPWGCACGTSSTVHASSDTALEKLPRVTCVRVHLLSPPPRAGRAATTRARSVVVSRRSSRSGSLHGAWVGSGFFYNNARELLPLTLDNL